MPQKIIDIDASQPLDAAIQQLQLPPLPLIILLGCFSPDSNEQIGAICRRVLAPLTLNPGALIVDDGKCSGCAAVFGRAAVGQDQMPHLLGIVPHSRISSDIDPNHPLILRLPEEWADAPKYTFQIADKLLSDPAVADRVVAVLFGGTDADKKSLIRCAKRNWPVVVVDNTGGLAEQIIGAITPDNSLVALPADPELREIVENATIYPVPLQGSVDDLERQILGRIDPRPETTVATLREAWARFDELDWAARVRQNWFRRIEFTLIVLGVTAALVAILTTVVPVTARSGRILHWAVLVTPITISIITAYNSHFRDGNKWIVLRGSAESLKREIFRFRARAGAYSDEKCQETSRESKLAARVKEITSLLEQSEVNKNNLDPRPEGQPERNTFLSPEEYIQKRLKDQVGYFVSKTRRLSRQLRATQLCIYVAGGIGTYLAAVHLDVWVALATAAVTALATKLQADQVENSLVQYNQALTSLRNVECWWKALSRWEKGRRKNIDVLVDQAEKALELETAGWVQQMQSALEKLTEKQPSSKAS